MAERRPSPAARVAALCVRAYQRLLSPLKTAVFGPAAGCRFHPTCSEYARQALLTHGFLRGIVLAAWRILRCHPFHPGGHDPVPPRAAAKTGSRARHRRANHGTNHLNG